MTSSSSPRHLAVHQATKPVVEALEGRVLLSGGAWTRAAALSVPQGHNVASVAKPATLGYPRTSPTDIMPAGIVRGPGAAPVGYNVTQIRHLYAWDNLPSLTFDPRFPLFTNSGDGESIVVVGAPTYGPSGNETINDVPMVRTGNLNKFNAGEPVTSGGPVEGAVAEENAEDLSTNFDRFEFGAIETTMEVEWAHAFAPAAHLFAEYVNTNNGVIALPDLKIGIQAAIDTLESLPEISSGPFNALPAGGVVVLSLSSVSEIAANQAQFDGLFSEARAANISFVASAGDTGGALAMPAVSPFVTAVGGTTYRIDGAGNRITETAALDAGGGQSTVEPLPAFQQGIKLGKKLLTGGRAVPDLALADMTRGLGVDAVYDPTVNGSDPTPWFTFEGTSVGAAIFGGMLADVNELRQSEDLPLIGSQVNAKMYSLYMQNPQQYFTDITAGNNRKHNATKGFDLATGMGAPRMDQLVPGLADTIGDISANLRFTGDQFAALGTGLNGVGVTAFRGTGNVSIGPEFVALTLTATAADGSTVTFDFPEIDRQLDNSITGTGTATVTNVTSGSTVDYNVQISGRVSKLTSRKPRVSGQIFTIDPLTGERLGVGPQSIFQGSFSST